MIGVGFVINWVLFPHSVKPDDMSRSIVEIFSKSEAMIDSEKFTYESNEVLKILEPELQKLGFQVEKSKKAEDKIHVPVLYGMNGRVEKSFEADGYHPECQYVLEVEAGRGYVNNQFLKDFFEACVMINVDKLCIAVRNKYKASNDFDKVCRFFDSLYASNKLQIPLSSLLIIGY